MAVAGNQVKNGNAKKVGPLQWNFVAEKVPEKKALHIPTIGPIQPSVRDAAKVAATNNTQKARFVPVDIQRLYQLQ